MHWFYTQPPKIESERVPIWAHQRGGSDDRSHRLIVFSTVQLHTHFPSLCALKDRHPDNFREPHSFGAFLCHL